MADRTELARGDGNLVRVIAWAKTKRRNRRRDSAGNQAHGPHGLPGLAHQRVRVDSNAVLHGRRQPLPNVRRIGEFFQAKEMPWYETRAFKFLVGFELEPKVCSNLN